MIVVTDFNKKDFGKMMLNSPEMGTVSYIMLQDRLSTGGSFILCDGSAQGFPIRYASAGFAELFGYTVAECTHVKCGDLVAGTTLRAESSIKRAAEMANLAEEQIVAGIDLMTEYTGNECKLIMENPGGKVSFSLVLNIRQDGFFFVNELIMLMHRHPVFGWPFFVGLQRNVNDDISPSELMRAATSSDKYNELIAAREMHVRDHVSNVGLDGKGAVQYLNDKACEAWLALMSISLDHDKKPSSLPSTLCSTTDDSEDGREDEESNYCGTLFDEILEVPDSSPFEVDGALSGVWVGVASPILGGYKQRFCFAEGRVSIEIAGKAMPCCYTIDLEASPQQLTLHMPKQGKLSRPPMKCIVKVEGEVLHFCCPANSAQRPTEFAGPGYCKMSKVHEVGPDVRSTVPEESTTASSCSGTSNSVKKDNVAIVAQASAPSHRRALVASAGGIAVIALTVALLRFRRAA